MTTLVRSIAAFVVSGESQAINLVMDLHDELELSYLVINLAAVEHISHRVAIRYAFDRCRDGRACDARARASLPVTCADVVSEF